MRDLEADLELCEKATPGPWEIGVWYCSARVNDGSQPSWVPPRNIPPGKCSLCAKNDDTPLVCTYKQKDGVTSHVHKYFKKDDWHDIYNAEGVGITGNYGEEEGGVCSKRDDAIFIAAAREGWPEAIRRAMDAEEKVNRQADALDKAASALSWIIHLSYGKSVAGEKVSASEFAAAVNECQEALDAIRKERGEK